MCQSHSDPVGHDQPGEFGSTRRDILRRGALLAAGGLAAMVPAEVAHADTRITDGRTQTTVYQGRTSFGYEKWEYVKFNVPPGVRRISVSSSFEPFVALPDLLANYLDMGIFGPSGFRGWSGNARRNFTLSAGDATPGYLPGPIQPGEWSVILGPVVYNPLGMGWEVVVTLEFGDPPPAFTPRLAPEAARGRGAGWYRGDMHVHTVHSDGKWTQAEVIAAARATGLDFIAATEHNTRSSALYWGPHVPPDFLVLNGEEVTTRYGHWLAVGLPPTEWLDWRYSPRDSGAYERGSARVHELDGLVIVAHPTTPGFSTTWKFSYDNVDALEVWNGGSLNDDSWSPDDAFTLLTWDGMLRSGRRITAVGNSDTHAHDDGILGNPQTVVYATSLSKKAILDGLRRGRAYLTQSSKISLSVSATSGDRQAGLGEELPVAWWDPVDVTARVTGAPNSYITAHTAWGQMAGTSVDSSGVGELHWRGWGAPSKYVRIEVRRGPTAFHSMLAMSNPIWFV